METNSFLDLHTHTRYPGKTFIKAQDIEIYTTSTC